MDYSPNRLRVFKDLFENERAFLIAGGPSLRDIDLSKLEDEVIFSVSLTYKADLPHMDFHFIGDKNITQQYADEIANIPTFFLFVSDGIYNSGLIKEPKNQLLYFTGHAKPGFYGHDVTKNIYGGGTSTYLGMQFAFYMGISSLYVVGLDHEWHFENTKGTGKFQGGKELLTTVGRDMHTRPNTQPWHLRKNLLRF